MVWPGVGLVEHTEHFLRFDRDGIFVDRSFRVGDCGQIESQMPREKRIDCNPLGVIVIVLLVWKVCIFDELFTAEKLVDIANVGKFDFGSVLSRLAGAGYDGWLVVEAEQDPEWANPLGYAREGHDYLLRAARHAGMTIAGEDG